MSCSLRYSLTLAIRLASWARVLVQPEHGRGFGGAGAGDGQLDPVADRHVLGLAGAPDVARGDLVFDQDVALAVHELDGAGGLDLEGLVVAAVFLGGLRHEAHVRDGAHGGGVEGAVGAAVVDDNLVDAGVAAVREDRERVGFLAVRAPHVAGGADHGGHGGVDDDVAGNVQVGDALVGVHHRQRGAVFQALLDGSLDAFADVLGKLFEAAEDGGQAVVGAQAGRGELLAVGVEQFGEVGLDHVAEDDGVGDLHHGGLQVCGEEHALFLGTGNLGRQELIQGGGAHHGAVNHFAGQDGEVRA